MSERAKRIARVSRPAAAERPAPQPHANGWAPHQLLVLQASAGNQAVRSLLDGRPTVQRDPPLIGDDGTVDSRTDAGTAEPASAEVSDSRNEASPSAQDTPVTDFGGLHGARWGGNALLEAAARDKARVHAGSEAAAVALVQQALLDVQEVHGNRYDLGTGGVAKDGVDGTYGGKTGAAVQAFKRDEQLGFTQFADVGPRTMHRLDDLLDSGPKPGPNPRPGPEPKDSDPDEPQRFEPPAPSGPSEQPAPATTALVEALIKFLTRTPPDLLLLFTTLKAVDIPATYSAIHVLRDTNPTAFATLKAQLGGLNVALALRLKVIVDGVENDDDLGVLEWKTSRAAQLAALPQADQDAILLAYDPRHPTLVKTQAAAGFGHLSATEKDQFLLYVGGANILSRRAGRRLGEVIDTPKFDKTVAKSFRDFRKAEETVGPLTELRNQFSQRPVSRTPTADGGKHAYQSRPAGLASDTTVVTVGAPTDADKALIPVFRPKADKLTPTLNYHTLDDIQKGLSTLPARNAKEILRVDVEPGPNPQDPHWKKVYKDANFHSYMTAGADRVVRVFPSSGAVPSETWMEGSFIHETGHIVSERAFGRGSTGPKWKPWKDAMKSDVIHPSDYAKKSPAEDFSEMVQLFQMEKGRRREQEIRKMFPARVAILDSMKLT
jgi:hypothetical protein